ncbi:MAG: CBS domain-containing protein [Xanthomonadales bacterium]|nr:CBS domain-containing protein [Xanthomonadales bacterium]
MGEQNIRANADDQTRRQFMKSLLNELQALELMLEEGLFERGARRIGAEQEFFLLDRSSRPAWRALDLLDVLNDERYTNELGLFNFEANLSPQTYSGQCLRTMEAELQTLYERARGAAERIDCKVAMCGILPTLSKPDLSLDAMMPSDRYRALNEALLKLRGSDFHININGLDTLSLRHDNLMLEACNTSFQTHFQVDAEEFPSLYNVAQLISGPVLAAAVNSPVLLGKRLWKESRIAVFEHSIDARSDAHTARGLKPRVHFGDHWVNESAVEIFREDIARFRVILTMDTEDDPLGLVRAGKIPKLNALRLHNGTVYRWNRACYGISENGAPHLRIEHRALPAGPSVPDAIANAAFFFGLMSGISRSMPDVREHFDFADVKANFMAAAREGLKAQQVWSGETQMPAQELILKELLPIAEEGLKKANLDKDDIERYLGIIEQRVASRRTGARWQLESLNKMSEDGSLDERLRSLTSSMVVQQHEGKPIHEWELADFCEKQDWRDSYRTVGQYMATDLFTVRPDDIVDFAASLMEWRHIRHVPVEDDSGHLLGLLSHRALLRLITSGNNNDHVTVREIMKEDPITVSPETSTVEAIRIMREQRLSCLPVVKDDKLVGILTEHDLIVVSSRLLEKLLS